MRNFKGKFGILGYMNYLAILQISTNGQGGTMDNEKLCGGGSNFVGLGF